MINRARGQRGPVAPQQTFAMRLRRILAACCPVPFGMCGPTADLRLLIIRVTDSGGGTAIDAKIATASTNGRSVRSCPYACSFPRTTVSSDGNPLTRPSSSYSRSPSAQRRLVVGRERAPAACARRNVPHSRRDSPRIHRYCCLFISARRVNLMAPACALFPIS